MKAKAPLNVSTRPAVGSRSLASPAGQPFSCSFDTAFGPVVVIWSMHDGAPRVMEAFISRPDADAFSLAGQSFPGMVSYSCPEVDELAWMMQAFLKGDEIAFPLGILRMDLVSPFQEKVLRAEYAIPRGRVSTYGRIAGHLGTPRGSRAVGTALATNPFPLIIPCHRAVRSDGSLGGYQGGLGMKRALLLMEGVPFTEKGRVEAARFYY